MSKNPKKPKKNSLNSNSIQTNLNDPAIIYNRIKNYSNNFIASQSVAMISSSSMWLSFINQSGIGASVSAG